MSLRLHITGKLPPLSLSSEVAAVRLFAGEDFGKQLVKIADAEVEL